MKIEVLSSGSKGNTTYIETDKSKILIDAGNSAKYIVSKLESIGVSADKLDAILLTHTHSDHINGLKVLQKKTSAIIYMTEPMHDNLDYIIIGPFIEEQKDLTLKWRGSSNQRIINVQESLKQNKVVEYENLK